MPYDIIMPKASLTMTEGTLLEWLCQDGAEIKKGDIIAQIETDKVVIDIEAAGDGRLVQKVEKGTEVPIAQVIGYILKPGETIADIPASDEKTDSIVTDPLTVKSPLETSTRIRSGDSGRVNASPLARRIAKELGVELTDVISSDPNGKISAEDVERFADAKKSSSSTIPATDSNRSLKKVPMTGIRGLIAQRMVQSARETAPVTLNLSVDADALVEYRKKTNDKYPDSKLSYDSAIIVLVARSLINHPRMNSRLVDNTIEEIADINVGVAVDSPRGLMTLVIKHADMKSWKEVNRELIDLVNKAKEHKTAMDELEGGTFTITNLGMHGVEFFTPIITPPQCAILGLGEIKKNPVVIGDQLAILFTLPLSLTFDHRIVDGAQAAEFMSELRRLIENPHSYLGSIDQ